MDWIPAVETLLDLHRCVSHPARVAILLTLHLGEAPASFPGIRQALGLTDGNLNRHLKVLIDECWIHSIRMGAGRGSRTTIGLTEIGRAGLRQFQAWVRQVDALLSSGSLADQEQDPPRKDGLLDDRSRAWIG